MPTKPADSGSAEPPQSSLDVSILPLGERALQSILDHVLVVGDEAETTYLEVKSGIDPRNNVGTAKIAKFLLAAANRRPQQSASYFQGYAVLVLGARKDHAEGVPRGVEPHELEDKLRPYLGPQFPPFEFGRLPVDDQHEVLFVVAQPPRDGQTIFSCHKDFHGDNRKDNLDDGAVYVRGSSNTRRARAGDIAALVERARGGGSSPITLDLQVLGPINRVERLEEVLKIMYDNEEREFSERPEPATKLGILDLRTSNILAGTQPMTLDERKAALDSWGSKKLEHVTRGRAHFLGSGLPGNGIRVVSHDRFVANPHLLVTFHECEVVDYLDAADVDYEEIVEPVVKGQGPFSIGPQHLTHQRFRSRDYPVAWASDGADAMITLTPKSFRPNTPWTDDQDDYVLLAKDPTAASVSVSWALTEDGNDVVTEGALQVPTRDPIDAGGLYGDLFSRG